MNLFKNLEKFSGNICVIDENLNNYTYKDLITLGDKMTLNIKKRSIVFLICENSYEFLAVYVGLIRKEILVFLISNEINIESLNKLMELYRPEFLVKPYQKKINISQLKSISNFHKKYQILKTKNKNYKIIKNLAILVSTSGSTGTPRFVKLSYENIFDNAKKIKKYLKITPRERPITTLQPNYIYGLSILNSHLISGSSIIVNRYSMVEKKFWEILSAAKATTFGGVPHTYNLLKKLNFEKMNLSSLKYITQAGGKINKDLLDKFINICKKKKIKMYVMYGQTEASGRISYLDWSQIERKKGSIGKAISGGKIKILKNNKFTNKKNEEGELIYFGKNVMLGYANKIKDLQKNIRITKLFTGDLAKQDEDGFFFITGRNSRLIKINSHRFNLDEIEEELKKNKIYCVCTGHDDNLKIFISHSFNNEILSNLIIKKFNIQRRNFKIFENFKIPRNENGKVLYGELK